MLIALNLFHTSGNDYCPSDHRAGTGGSMVQVV